MKSSFPESDTGVPDTKISDLKVFDVKKVTNETNRILDMKKEVLEIDGKGERTETNESQVGKRRKHKNSKNGCPNCKKRRVKCSEDLPACANCVRRKARCGYLDYTDEQLKDLKQSKFMVENADNYSVNQSKKQTDAKVSTIRTEGQQPSPASINTLTTSNSFALSNDNNYDMVGGTFGSNDPNFNENYNNDNGVNNVLNFQQNLVNKDGDNLLTTAEYPIVYPVYSMKDTNMVTENHNVANFHSNLDASPSFKVSRDVFSSGAFNTGKKSSPSSETFISPLSSDYLDYSSQTSAIQMGKVLPGAKESTVSFKRIIQPSIDYGQLIYDLMVKFGPQLASGTCSLKDNIYLYSMWLHSFIYYSFTEKAMFGCMINFTTNYMISSCWMPEFISKDFTALIDRTKVRNLLISSSIRHYSMAIKELRRVLNKNSNPLLCSSASFVLSLTSIYDPAATVRSMNCFRDGLFSILQHNVTNVTKRGESLPFMLMMHLEILKNFVRTVYLPAYDPGVLFEYRSMLTTFGNILKMLNTSSDADCFDSKSIYSRKLFEKKFNDIMVFTNEIVSSYLPTINSNLDKSDLQEQCLFEILHKWVRIFPVKAMSLTCENDPIEIVLYYFYKSLKKMLYAIFPQVKYFYVREFDSPVTVDISVAEEEFEIFLKGFEYSEAFAYPEHLYEQVVNDLRSLCSYSIRLIIFFQKRLEILNRTVIFDWSVKEAFPIDDIKKFRSEVTDIAETRDGFCSTVQLSEVPITSFTTTLIKPHHYPRRFVKGYDNFIDGKIVDHVDLLTLTSNGLLANDYKEQ